MPLLCRIGCCLLAVFCLIDSQVVAQKYKPEDILKPYRPRQRGVEYDTPPAEEFSKCRLEVERGKGAAGFVVYGPAGQILRRMTDTNGDGTPDMFRYYRLGLEVYRDIDSNFNNKPDQYRWMNWGGTRWGIDRNEDGRIDEWKMLSAPEAAQVAVEAMIAGDARLLSTVLISSADIGRLKISSATAESLLKSVAKPEAQLSRLLKGSRVINNRTRWERFDPPVPGLIPAEQGRFGSDLMVYENAMAMVSNGRSQSPDLVSIGEMVRVGDVWKLTSLPQPLDAENAQVQLGGVLMQPQTADALMEQADSISQDLQDLLKKLQSVDENMPRVGSAPTPQQLVDYNRRRADLIERIIPLVKDSQQKSEWIQQYADGLAAAVQTGEYPDGLHRLKRLQSQVAQNEELLGHVSYRCLLAEYAVRLQSSKEEDIETNRNWWLAELQKYAAKWPKSADAADAIIQLAISLELTGRIDDARTWYTRLAQDHAKTNGGIRARGALRRLDLTGKKLDLTGKSLTGQNVSAAQYQNKVLLVAFWDSWTKPYTDDLPAIEAVYRKYQKSGFEILGVNLDANAARVQPTIRKFGGNWTHIRDAGGTDGRLAREFGIVSLPTMFLVDRRGIVAGAVTAENLEQAVSSLLAGKPLGSGSPGQTPPPQGSAGQPPARN